jgi:hypothetical protein
MKARRSASSIGDDVVLRLFLDGLGAARAAILLERMDRNELCMRMRRNHLFR